MPVVRQSELAAILNPADPRDVRDQFRAVGRLLGIDRRRAIVTWGDESADARACRVRVVDRVDAPQAGRYLVLVWIATSEFGAPGGTQTFGSATAGTIVHTLTADKTVLVETGADGVASFPVTVTGAGTRYAQALCLGEIASFAASWVA